MFLTSSYLGDPTEKYFTLRRVIQKYRGQHLEPVPKPSKKVAYGKIPLSHSLSLFEFVKRVYPKPPSTSYYDPATMEQVGQAYGFLFYRSNLPSHGGMDIEKSVLNGRVHDRSIVFVDGKRQATVERGILNITIDKGQQLEVLVENQGKWVD